MPIELVPNNNIVNIQIKLHLYEMIYFAWHHIGFTSFYLLASLKMYSLWSLTDIVISLCRVCLHA